jgi:aerobic carbon-monoxide dehydrogenase medium subunit
MKPVAFDYVRPTSVAEAADLLANEAIFSKPIAGSQSLGPMLNLRVAQPELLVDITSIPQLSAIADHGRHVDIGACITHADIEDGRIPDPSFGLLSFVAGRIAYRAVRNRGTIGGSLAHSDPAADWVSVMPLLGAILLLRSSQGERLIPAEELMRSSFVTSLKAGEMIHTIRIPKMGTGARWGFFKFNQKAGEFAHMIAGILHDPANKRFRAVIGAIETAPIIVSDATFLFAGPFGSNLADRLDQSAVLTLLDGKNVTDDYRRQLCVVALKRAATQASQS